MWNLLAVALCLLVASLQVDACSEVCYEGYGCYHDCGVWDCCPLPQSPEQIGTRFRVHTRQRMGTFEFEVIFPDDLGNAFDASRRTVFLVHGFTQSGYSSWVQDMYEALLNREDMNVILVDWRDGASIAIRAFPASNTRVVGSVIAELAQALVDDRGMRWEDVQCIGFSAGAHACGFFGKNVTSGIVDRVTGLDPAGDSFNHNEEIERLSAGDARFTDIIHTNAYGAIPSGINRDCGDVDFWANGGRDQPGCLILGEICDHQRAPTYYQSTVENQCTFDPAQCASPILGNTREDECNSCSSANCQQEVGITSITNPGRGTYWFNVVGSYPHCPN